MTTKNYSDFFQSSEFRVVMNALKALDFSDSAVESIWKLVAVILHLGNLEFYADDKDHVSISQLHQQLFENIVDPTLRPILYNKCINNLTCWRTRNYRFAFLFNKAAIRDTNGMLSKISGMIEVDQKDLVSALVTRVIAANNEVRIISLAFLLQFQRWCDWELQYSYNH